MTRNLIIGAFSDYDWPQIAPWVTSLNRCGFQGDKVMIVFNASYETINKLFEHDFKAIILSRDDEKQRATYHSPLKIYVERFFFIYQYLQQVWQNYDYVITTDVRDVIFQINPVLWLREQLGDKQLVAGSESIRYRDEAWNRENLLQAYGTQIYDLFKDNEVYNVGTLGGTAEAVKDLMLNIFSASVGRHYAVVDQAVFNVIIQSTPYKNIVKFACAADGWACQAGVSVAPDKIMGFRPFLTDKEPVFDKGIVKTAEGKIFALVHQYNRVPEWNTHFMTKYGT